MVTFTFGILKKVTRNMQPQGKRHYQVDYDRGAIIEDRPDGTVVHRYVDESPSLWRDAFGNVLLGQEVEQEITAAPEQEKTTEQQSTPAQEINHE
jgi:hypothetical protein